jgi:hypothetical protein
MFWNFVSEVFHDAKFRYPEVHKLLYAILAMFWNLKQNFQSHPVSLVTSFSLNVVMHNQHTIERFANGY